MPIFEYVCSKCEKNFDELVMSSEAKIVCPECGSAKVDKQFSLFASSGSCGGCDSGGGHT